MATETLTLEQRIKRHAQDLGFDLVGIAALRESDHAEFYHDWIAQRRHGEMAYLARPDAVERRLDPRAGWPALRSAIVVALNYYAEEETVTAESDAESSRPQQIASDPSRGIIARYARGRDYHKVLKKKLLALLDRIEAETGHELSAARAYVDTGPVLERELARRAGLGWFGRSTMLINPKRGSYFFLGSLLVELELEPDAPFMQDHCGTCNACVEACPTGALLGRDANGAPVIDATRCISYLTIENRGAIPRELRPLIGNRIFGCDICQEVCPWNAPKFVQITGERDFAIRGRGDTATSLNDSEAPSGTTLPGAGAPSLVELMHMTRDQWDVWTRGSALRRAGYTGFKRNVAVAMGNWLAKVEEAPLEAIAVLKAALHDESELVREHAAWALEQIAPPHCSTTSPSAT